MRCSRRVACSLPRGGRCSIFTLCLIADYTRVDYINLIPTRARRVATLERGNNVLRLVISRKREPGLTLFTLVRFFAPRSEGGTCSVETLFATFDHLLDRRAKRL